MVYISNKFITLVILCFTVSWCLRTPRKHDARKVSDAPHDNVSGYIEYIPGMGEEAMMHLIDELGFNELNNPNTCSFYENSSFQLEEYLKDLDNYNVVFNNFSSISNLMTNIKHSRARDLPGICKTTRLHPEGMMGLFPSNQLSLTSSGYVEPLLPPLRHPKFCKNKSFLMSMDYLIHDFEAMCHTLRPHSKLVLIDMGASLSFHGGNQQPIQWLLARFKKMGFHFDHIYGFEITYTDPKTVYETLLPSGYFPSYHWINVGVSSDIEGKLNPLHSILKQFEEDDYILVKLDIDTSHIENPLAQQLLEDESYSKLVDHFYFEHHVHLGELRNYWGRSMNGTVKDSLDLFSQLRQKGIPSHFWP